DDPDSANDTGYAPVIVTRQAGLSLTAAPPDTEPAPDAPISYRLTARNFGTSTATGVVVTDTLPPDVELASAVLPGGTCTSAGALVTCLLADPLAVDATV